MQHRYYIGLQLPPELRARVAATQQAFFDPALMHRPLEPHITLLPPPAVERIEPEELARQAKSTAAPFWPLKLVLSGFETYQEHTVALRVESEQLRALQKQLAALLPPEVEISYYPNPTFSPHVTLARTQHGTALPPELVACFEQQLAGLLPTSFEVNQLTLFRWRRPGKYEATPF